MSLIPKNRLLRVQITWVSEPASSQVPLYHGKLAKGYNKPYPVRAPGGTASPHSPERYSNLIISISSPSDISRGHRGNRSDQILILTVLC